MRRNKHGLSHYVLSSFDMGQLIPVGHFEVLPGDSIRMSTSCLIRVSPLMAPVMHPVVVRIHHWFVPYRIVWDRWEDFITGGADGLGEGAGMPPTNSGSVWDPKTLPDYMGIPPLGAATNYNLFPLNAYNMIYNEFYRDQDLSVEVPLDSANVRNIAWEKDYFTSARPWTQKGPDVTIPLGLRAPVVGAGTPLVGDLTRRPFLRSIDGTSPDGGIATSGTGALSISNPTSGTPQLTEWGSQTGLEADLAAAVSPSVGDFRLAFALQRYQEARAQYGSRYTEYLRYLGVRSSDARLQRPEYLGGGRSTISFSEVLKTGEGDTPSDETPIGEMRGHGISAMRSRRWIRFFEEHGVVVSLCSIRPRSMYTDGVHRSWIRRTKEDYWQKELELIGQQEIKNVEVYGTHADPSGTFGYQDRYAEYRHLPSYVTSEFRNVLNDWHLARSFGSAPALNSDFVTCVPSKRIHAEQTQNSIWGMFSHSIQARRMVTNKTIGRIF